MEYYHSLITQKSWEELQELRKRIDFILIGGWAVYLYTKNLKSKDIDIIVDFDQLAKLEKYYSLAKNERLKKYEARTGEIEIDVYLPHYSKLGIPVEDLIKHERSLEGFKVLDPNCLLILKLHTLTKRGRTTKGRKDFIDAIALINSGIADLSEAQKIAARHKLQRDLDEFETLLGEHYELPELNLNSHSFARLKKRILSVLK